MSDYLGSANDDGHAHVFGAWDRSRFGGTVVRYCEVPFCSVVSLDGDDDYEGEEE